MDLRLLRYFVACVEHKTMHAAAAAVHVSQPALSKAIANLEKELGVRLLDRRPRGIVPSPYGEALFRYAKLIDSEMRRAKAEIDAMRGMTSGTIVVGVIPTMSAIMADVASEILSLHPGLKLKLRVGFSSELSSALNEGEIDVALLLLSEGGAPVGLAFEPLLRTGPLVVVRQHHPLAGQKNLTLEALAGFPWLIPEYPPSHGAIINRVFLDAGLRPPVSAIEVSTIVFFEDLISLTDLVTIVPATLLSVRDHNSQLTGLDVNFKFPPEEVGMAYRENNTLLPGAKVLIDLVRKKCAALPNYALAER